MKSWSICLGYKIMSSSSFLLKYKTSFYSRAEEQSSVYGTASSSTHLQMDACLDWWFACLDYGKNGAVGTGVQMLAHWPHFLGCRLGRGFPGSCNTSISFFQRSRCTHCYNSCINLNSHQQYIRGFLTSHLHQNLAVAPWITAMPAHVRVLAQHVWLPAGWWLWFLLLWERIMSKTFYCSCWPFLYLL